jgi:general secretion pathway protein E/type IV pilus assembly protein PilB
MKQIDLTKADLASFQDPYSREFMSRNGVVKFYEDEFQVKVAAAEGVGNGVQGYLEGYHFPKRVDFYQVSRADFASFIGETASVEPPPAERKGSRETKFTLDAVTQDAPVINIINAICIEAIRLEASDIHIEAHSDAVYIRYRIDGVLKTIKKLEKSLFLSLSNRIKIMANMNTMESRLPQDGRMTVATGGEDIDLRVSVIPITSGESIVLRIFNKSAKALALEELGFCGRDLERMKSCVKQPHGLILLTGPTGSGKTTTLHALLETLPVKDLKVVAIEDPVEQIIPGVNQVQINDNINLSFDGMLRRVLRQDPNVIMVGEIRDKATAELALRSALTGHLILSTLHTNDSLSVIARLENMGLEPYLIGAVLKCAAAQRLVRKICPQCSKKAPIPREIKSMMKKYNIEGNSMVIPAGCEKCGYSGYQGRTVTGEVMVIDSSIEEMIVKRKSPGDIAKYALSSGMSFMIHDALQKLANGVTTLTEIEREIML